MNIAEKFNQNKQAKEQQQKNQEAQWLTELVLKITTALNDKETIESLENFLSENGSIALKDFGCLCQRSFCSWQAGLDNILEPLIEEWNKKGVQIRLSLKMKFYVPGGLSIYTPERTIEQLKQWNKQYKAEKGNVHE